MTTDELKKLAEAATPGPWIANDWANTDSDGSINVCGISVTAPNSLCGIFTVALEGDGTNDVDYIAAANPAAILKLLAINAELVEALSDAATSLETINRLAGKASYGVDKDGPIPTYMGHHDEVRAYAGSRAGCARAALAKAEGGEL